LALNIDMDSNILDLKIVKSVGIYFRLSENETKSIIEEVRESVANWRKVADEIGISRNEQMLMSGAFKI